MANPPKPVEIKSGEVTYVSNVDRTIYTVKELSKMALRDVAKLLRQRIKAPGNMPKQTGALSRNVGTWVRVDKNTEEIELQVGVYNQERAAKRNMPYAFYGKFLELGTSRARPVNNGKGFIRHIVEGSVDDIRRIEAQYLEYVEDDMRAMALIEDGEEIADD